MMVRNPDCCEWALRDNGDNLGGSDLLSSPVSACLETVLAALAQKEAAPARCQLRMA